MTWTRWKHHVTGGFWIRWRINDKGQVTAWQSQTTDPEDDE